MIYIEDETRQAVMQEINWLKAIGFKVIRSQPLHFTCTSEGRKITFAASTVTLEDPGLNNVKLDLVETGSEFFRKTVATFLYIKKYMQHDELDEPIYVNEVAIYGYGEVNDPSKSVNL